MNRVANLVARGRRLYLVAILTGISTAAGLIYAAAELKPKPYDRLISRTIARLVAEDHLSKHALNEEISQRTFLTYMKTLDPMKVYFMQSDIDEFSKSKNTLADSIKRGDVSFAYTVFDRFLQRVDQRVALIDDILSKPMDFHTDENLITDPKITTYAKTDEELRSKWQRRIKYDELSKMADKADKAEEDKKSAAASNGKAAHDGEAIQQREIQAKETPEEKISRRYHSFAKRMHQTTADELLEALFDRVHQQLRSTHQLHVGLDAGGFRHQHAPAVGGHRRGLEVRAGRRLHESQSACSRRAGGKRCSPEAGG